MADGKTLFQEMLLVVIRIHFFDKISGSMRVGRSDATLYVHLDIYDQQYEHQVSMDYAFVIRVKGCVSYLRKTLISIAHYV